MTKNNLVLNMSLKACMLSGKKEILTKGTPCKFYFYPGKFGLDIELLSVHVFEWFLTTSHLPLMNKINID